MRRLLVLFVLASCGDNRPAPVRSSVALEVPASAAPGAPLPLHIVIHGTGARSLFVTAQAPGVSAPGDGVRFVQEGAAPPTGAITYLTAGGWTADAAPFTTDLGEPEATLELSPPLPTAGVGSWSVQVVVRDGDGAPLAAAARATLISDRPALALEIDRVWAMGDDPVHVAVRTVSAGRDVGVIAWLTTPDGRELPLPQADVPNAIVPNDDLLRLLGEPLGASGTGTYRVAARLVDRATGEYLAAGGAGFTVCDTLGSASGTVLDDTGAPLGAGAEAATVTFTAVARGVFDVRDSAIDESGHYALADLPVGTWLVSARVDDAAGGHAVAPRFVEIGCEQPTALDLRSGPAQTSSAIVRGVARQRAAPPKAPKPTTVVRCKPTSAPSVAIFVSSPNAPDHVDTVAGVARDLIAGAGLTALGQSETEAVLRTAQIGQQVDGPDHDIAAELSAVSAADFLWNIKIQQLGERMIFNAALINPASVRTIRSFTVDAATPINVTKIKRALGAIQADTLLDELVTVAGKFSKPHTAITFAPKTPARSADGTQSDSLTFTTTVDDAATCKLAPAGTQVALTSSPGITFVPPSAATDSKGIAHHSFSGTSPAAVLTVTAAVVVDGVEHTSDPIDVRYQPLGNARVTAGKSRLAPGTSTEVTVTTVHTTFKITSGFPFFEFTREAETKITVTTQNGTLAADTPGNLLPAASNMVEVTTDQNGEARFTFTAGATPGIAQISVLRADSPEDNRVTAELVVEPPLAITMFAEPTPQALLGQEIALAAFVDLPNGDRAVGVDVAFAIATGDGQVRTVIGKTGADGKATALYTAPAVEGTTVVRARASLDGFTATRNISIENRRPCTDCPISIASDLFACPKGGTIHFIANQIVRWSTTTGTITPAGVLTCGMLGGEFTVTATSVENQGLTGTKSLVVIPTPAEYEQAPDAIVQDLVVNSFCATPGVTTGSISIIDKPPPAPADLVDILYTFGNGCGISFGVGDNQFAPRINSQTGQISQTIVDNISGCLLSQISVQPVGPGMAGVRGAITLGRVNAGVCEIAVAGSFGPP